MGNADSKPASPKKGKKSKGSAASLAAEADQPGTSAAAAAPSAPAAAAAAAPSAAEPSAGASGGDSSAAAAAEAPAEANSGDADAADGDAAAADEEKDVGDYVQVDLINQIVLPKPREAPVLATKGVSIAYLVSMRSKIKDEWTARDVREHLILPEVEQKKTAFIETIQAFQTGKAGFYLSYAWDSPFLGAIDALEHWSQKNAKPPSSTYVWVDLFCQPQHSGREPMHREFIITSIPRLIKTIGALLVVPNPWRERAVFTRAWCLWEINCAVRTSSSVDLALTAEGHQTLVDQIAQKSVSIAKAFCVVDIDNSQATDPEDRSNLIQAFTEMGSLGAGNKTIAAAMRIWVKKIVLDAMKTRSPESSWEFEEEQIFYRIQAARLLAATQHQKEALEMLNEAMDAASRKPEVEDDDINILQALDCKANCMRATGDKRGSWDTYQTLLMMLQIKNGSNHESTLSCMENVAAASAAAGQHSKCQEMRKEIWRMKEELLGPEDPTVLASLDKLADSYKGIENMEEHYLDLCRQCAEKRAAALGPVHGDTYASRVKLAEALVKAGRGDEALKVHQDMLADCRKDDQATGKVSRFTLLVLDSLTTMLEERGDSAGSREHREALAAAYAKYTSYPGAPRLPPTVSIIVTIQGLAKIYGEEGKHRGLCNVYQLVARASKAVYGSFHPNTVKALGNVAVSLGEIGRPEEALRINEELLAFRRRKLPKDHPDIVTSLINVAGCLSKLGRSEDALKNRLEAVEIASASKQLGPTHASTLIAKAALIANYAELKRYDDAVRVGEEAVAAMTKTFGPDHARTKMAAKNLATAKAQQGK